MEQNSAQEELVMNSTKLPSLKERFFEKASEKKKAL
jgi:hypothetical protein